MTRRPGAATTSNGLPRMPGGMLAYAGSASPSCGFRMSSSFSSRSLPLNSSGRHSRLGEPFALCTVPMTWRQRAKVEGRKDKKCLRLSSQAKRAGVTQSLSFTLGVELRDERCTAYSGRARGTCGTYRIRLGFFIDATCAIANIVFDLGVLRIGRN
jgi:hypothetical protein